MREYHGWLEEAGFGEVEHTYLEGGSSLLVARKPKQLLLR